MKMASRGIAAEHDDLVATKERRHGVCREHLSLFQIGHRMKRERAGDTGHRVEVDILDVAVLGEELLHLRVRQGSGTAVHWGVVDAERRLVSEGHPALVIDVDREILESTWLVVLSVS